MMSDSQLLVVLYAALDELMRRGTLPPMVFMPRTEVDAWIEREKQHTPNRGEPAGE